MTACFDSGMPTHAPGPDLSTGQDKHAVYAAAIYLALAALAGLLFAACVPTLIEKAYAGESIPVLSRILSGRDVHTVGHYVEVATWTFLAVFFVGTFALFTGLHIFDIFSYRIVLGTILLMGLVLRLHVALKDPTALQGWPLNDDSHYYFNIARNLANGNGLRHDSFNTTNGFQPLFLLLITPFYLVTESRLVAVRLILIMQAMLGVLNALVLAFFTRRMATGFLSLLVAGVWCLSDKKSLFKRHGHPPAGTGLNHSGNVAESVR